MSMLKSDNRVGPPQGSAMEAVLAVLANQFQVKPSCHRSRGREVCVRVIAIVFALTSALVVSTTGAAAGPAPPKEFEHLSDRFPAPKTPFADEYATSTTIDAFKGKIVILNFWATWCAPCIKEMPSLERLAARLPAEKFAVIAVSQDKGGASIAKPFLNRIGVHSLPLYVDPNGRLSRDLSVRGLPTTVVIARDGTVIGKLEGAAEWDANDMVAYLISLSNLSER